jgi:glutamate transport system permease protein
MGVITENLDVFGRGLLVTLQISVATFVLAGLLGLVLATFRISPVPPLRVFSHLYVAVVRSIPLLVLLTVFVFGLPEIGLVWSLKTTVILAMSLYWAAFFGETLRAGVRSVPVGQIEAVRALGLTFGQGLRLVVLPQAVRSSIQPLASLLIAVTLNSSLAAAVGVTQELTGQTELLDQQYAQPLLTFGAAAACYVAFTMLIGRAAARLERTLVVLR